MGPLCLWQCFNVFVHCDAKPAAENVCSERKPVSKLPPHPMHHSPDFLEFLLSFSLGTHLLKVDC